MSPQTRTETVLPRMVEAVQADLAWAVARVSEGIEMLHALEELLRHDRQVRIACHGTAEALQTLADGLTKESTDYGARTLPAHEGASEGPNLRVMGG